LIIMGLSDLGYQAYARSILQGAINEAARSSTLEKNVNYLSAVDDRVSDQTATMSKNGEITITRRSYYTFSDIGKSEEYIDSNKNGKRDNNECYYDVNGDKSFNNGSSSGDRGMNGLGGPDDIVLYRATMDYPRIFPMSGLLGWTEDGKVSAQTAIRNQPYGSQTTRSAPCTV
jgi:hypothetical protein